MAFFHGYVRVVLDYVLDYIKNGWSNVARGVVGAEDCIWELIKQFSGVLVSLLEVSLCLY